MCRLWINLFAFGLGLLSNPLADRERKLALVPFFLEHAKLGEIREFNENVSKLAHFWSCTVLRVKIYIFMV